MTSSLNLDNSYDIIKKNAKDNQKSDHKFVSSWKGAQKVSILDAGSVLAATQNESSKGIGGSRKAAADKMSFAQQMQKIKSANASGLEAYTEYLQARFGIVTVKSVGKDQKSMNLWGRKPLERETS